MSNLPKGISEYDIRELFSEHELKIVTMYCCNDPYYPTSTAVLNFATKLAMKSVLGHHHDEYRGKRVYIKMTLQPWADRDFPPKNTLMLKNLNEGNYVSLPILVYFHMIFIRYFLFGNSHQRGGHSPGSGENSWPGHGRRRPQAHAPLRVFRSHWGPGGAQSYAPASKSTD